MNESKPSSRPSPFSVALVMLAIFANVALPLWMTLRLLREPAYRSRVERRLERMGTPSTWEDDAARFVAGWAREAPLAEPDRRGLGDALELATRDMLRRIGLVVPVAGSGFLLMIGAALAAFSHWPEGVHGKRWYSPLLASQAKRWAIACAGLAWLIPPLLLAALPNVPHAAWTALGLAGAASAALYLYLGRLPYRV